METPQDDFVFVTLKKKPNPRLIAEVAEQSIYHLGSSYDSKTSDILRGLSFKEEDVLLPEIIGVSSDSYEFVAATKKFWSSIDLPIPNAGKVLNITTRKVKKTITGPDGKTEQIPLEIPLVPLDYIHYRYALKHSKVGRNLEEAIGRNDIDIYIEDHKAEADAKINSLDAKNKARQKYLEIATGEAKDYDLMKAIIINTRDAHGKGVPLNQDEILLLLDIIHEKFPTAFIEAANDTSLKQRAFINQLLDYQIIHTADNQVFDDKKGNDPLAKDINGFIKFISLPEQTAYLAQLKATLASKKGK